MTDGWSSVMKVLLWLFHLDLIPHTIFEMEDFTDSTGIPLPSLSDPINEEHGQNDEESTVNVLTSWISNAFGSIFESPPNEMEKISIEQSEEIEKAQAANIDEQQFSNQPKKCQNIMDSITECAIGHIFSSSKSYHINSFVHLVRTLISLSNTYCDTTVAASSFFDSAHTPSVTTHTITSLDPIPIQTSQLIESNEEEKKKETNEQEDVICLPLTIDMKIFCLERLSQCLSANIKRINEVWTMIDDHFKSLIMAQQNHKHQSDDRHSHYFFERITVNMMKLCVELMDENAKNIDRVLVFLNLFLSLDDAILFIVGRRIIAGIKLLLNVHCDCFVEEKEWKTILFLMKRFSHNYRDKLCCLEAFQFIESVANDHLNAVNFNHVLNVLTVFGRHELEAPVHNTRVIEIMLSIHSRLVSISNNNQSVLSQMFHKTLSNIARFGGNNDYKTRQFALNCLHKALLQSPCNIAKDENSKLLFETILFPLLLQLTKLENQRLSPENVDLNGTDDDDLRLKLLTLVFQVWLHDIYILIGSDDHFHLLWFKFLAVIRKFILMVKEHKHNGANLVIHCCESLKNVILVFQSSNVFQKLSDKTGKNIWDETWKMLDDVAPNLKQEIVEVE